MKSMQITASKSAKALPAPENLGFGLHFSDHWFSAKYSPKMGWHDAHVQPYGPFAIDPGASVLHYGQALFEGMKAFRQKNGEISFFRPDFNFERMKEGSERLCMEAPPRELFMAGLKELVNLDARWVPTAENCSLYIRPTLIGTEAFLGVRPAQEYLFFILLSPVGSYYGEGAKALRIWVEDSYLRAAPGGLGATKAAANYAASLKAALEAKKKGYAQVLWLDVEHQGVEEVGTMNVFFVLKNEIVTPALNGSILAGGVRNAAIDLLRHRGFTVNERRITITEITQKIQSGELTEAFGTGTAAVISPIGELFYKGKAWSLPQQEAGPVARRLLKEITDIQRGLAPDELGWMVPLSQL